MDRDDVGMLQAGGELDLAKEPLGAKGLSQLRAKHLECHGAVVAEVVRQIHHGHPAATELPLDAIMSGEG
jgi:hypothetical protein